MSLDFEYYYDISDNEVADQIAAVPTHFVQVPIVAQSNTGTTTATAPAAPGVAWNLTSLQISQAGGTVGPNAVLNVWDGAVGVKLIFSVYLAAPGAGTWLGTGGLGGSTGIIQDIPLPKTPSGFASLQGTPGNAMNVQVVGTGNNNVTINARFTDAVGT
jgi:hypothetical protein